MSIVVEDASLSRLASSGGSLTNLVALIVPPSRWIKFEEKVEKGGERWSKPHVATLSLHSLMELRTCIEKGTVMLDMEASTLSQVVGKFRLSLPGPRTAVPKKQAHDWWRCGACNTSAVDHF